MSGPCEVCQNTAARPAFVKQGYRFVQCTVCRHVCVDADLDRTDMLRIYREHFFSAGGYADYVADEALHRQNFARYLPVLRRHRTGGRLLEIGCAYGFFLDVARREWEVSGIDINAEAVAHAHGRLGLDVVCADLLDLDVKEEVHDAVVMWDTIEHLRQPARYLERVARMLKPGGILALTTGDAGSWVARLRGRRWRLYYPPEHLHFFTRATMGRLLARFGLDVVEMRAVGFYRSLDMMLHRLLRDRRSGFGCTVYRAARWTRLTRPAMYLNLGDIMLVVARKRMAP